MTSTSTRRDPAGDWVLVGTVDRDGLPVAGLLRWTGTPADPTPRVEVLVWAELHAAEATALAELLTKGIAEMGGGS